MYAILLFCTITGKYFQKAGKLKAHFLGKIAPFHDVNIFVMISLKTALMLTKILSFPTANLEVPFFC